MSQRAYVEAQIRQGLKTGDLNLSALSRDSGIPRSTISDWKQQIEKEENTNAGSDTGGRHYRPEPVSVSDDQSDSDSDVNAEDRLSQFSHQFDRSYYIPETIWKVINEWLSKESVIWCRDEEMQKRCGVSNIKDWKNYGRDNETFEEYQVRLPNGKIVWAAKEYRDELQRRALT